MTVNNLPEVLLSKSPKVYQNKKLNTANFGDFNHSDYHVFLHLVSKIGGVDKFGKYLQPHELQREHTLTAKEFSELFNTNLSNSYKIIHKACKKLMKTSIILEKIEKKETWEINVCSMAIYNKNQGSITMEFTDKIMPYLAQVKERFVLYNLKEIANFGSLYTTRLYELIQGFKETGWMLISLDQLRVVFALGNKFKMYGHLKNKILIPACKEINNNYDMDLKFEEEKEGRKVVAVKFFFKKILVHNVTNPKTGISKNVYQKPKLLVKNKKGKVKQTNSDFLEGQLSFNDLKINDNAKPVNNIITSLLTKIFSDKK
jgi:plasmid replication initiation protein